MTKRDIEQVKLVVTGAVNDSMKPFMNELEECKRKQVEHEHLLVGVKGDDGMVKTVSDHSESIASLKLSAVKLWALATAVGSVAGFLGTLIGRFLFK